MSDDHTDPIDKAYASAEAALDDEAARAARRARVLAAVAQAPPTAAEPALPARRHWRPAGWLMAASVAGLAVIVATRVYEPPPPRPQTTPPPAAAAAPAASGAAADARLAAPPAPQARSREALPGAVQAERSEPAASPATVPFAVPPPPPAPAEQERRAFPAAQPAPAPPPAPAADASVEEVVVTSSRRSEAQATPPPAARAAAAPALAGMASDRAARLRAAAAAGRTAEVTALLDQGVSIDAADADGDTALMEAVRANKPAVAALLRRRGASLERENRAGESAKDMAKAKDDAELDQAVGLDR